MKIILASGSPRRKELLEQIGLEFTVHRPEVEEFSSQTSPDKYVLELSHLKGDSVRKTLNDENTLVIASDTIVWFDGKILEKPSSESEAIETLKSLSGKTHDVYTAVSCFYKGGELHFVDKTAVEFYSLNRDFIHDYVQSGEPLDKAGSYGIQGTGQLMVKSIKGTFPTVMGFPTSRFYAEVKKWLKDESPL